MSLNLNRRSLLTTLGKAFGASGLILSSGRSGALALSANLDAAASLPLVPATLPVSPELVHWRALVDDQYAFRLRMRGRQTLASCDEYYRRSMVIRGVNEQIAGREHRTWADCVELAEICWHIMPKEEAPSPLGPKYAGEPTGRLNRDPDLVYVSAYHCAQPLVALVEAVLTLGNGERRDPKTDQGRF